MSVKATSSVTIADVSDGLEGTGISSTKVEYQAGSSGTSAPTGTWSTSVPSTSASAPYLWTRVTYTYSDGRDPVYVYSVGSTPEGIKIGGRNLLKGTNKIGVTYDYPTSGSADGKSWTTTIPLNGDTYTLSFWAKSTVNGDKLRVHFYDPSNVTSVKGSQGQTENNGDGRCDFTLSTTLTKYWVTYTIPKGGNSTRKVIIPRIFNSFGSGTLTLQWEKLEEGNKATDWTPAPEDTEESITEVKTIAEQTADKFSWLVKSGTSATNFELTDRTATLVANHINLNGLVTFSGLGSDAQNGIINSIEVGGRNLLWNSTMNDATGLRSNWTHTWMNSVTSVGFTEGVNEGVKIVTPDGGNSNNGIGLYLRFKNHSSWEQYPIDINYGETITISLDVKGVSVGGAGVCIWHTNPYSDAWYAKERYSLKLSDLSEAEFKRYSFTVTLPVESELYADSKCKYVMLGLRAGINATVYFRNIKVERGNKATDWTPAPEDTEAEIQSVKTIADNANNTIADWCYNNDKTYINGGKIYTGSIAAKQISSGAITTDKLAANAVTAEKIDVKDLFSKNITATNMTISGNSIFGNFYASDSIEGLTYENSNYGGIMYLGKIAALIDEDAYGFQLGNGNSMTNIQPGGVFVQSNCGGSYSRKTTIHGGFIETYCISTSQSGGTVSIGSDIVPLYSDEDTLLDITLGSSSKKFADLYTSKINGTSVNSDGIASTSGYGVTKLSSSYTSSSTNIAANSNAVYSLYNKMKTIVTRGVATGIFSSFTYDNNRLRCVKINSVTYSMTMFGGVIEVTNGSTAISYQWSPFFQIPKEFRPSTTIQTVVHVFYKETSRLSATYAVEIYTDGTVLINGSFAASESFRFVFPCIMYI